jgi:hypothetical protein
MYTVVKTKEGFSVLDKRTQTLKCGHNYPSLKNCSIGCRTEIKDLFGPNQNSVNFEFIDSLKNKKGKATISLPVFNEYIEEMVNTKDPVLLKIKKGLEDLDDPTFLEFFLLGCRRYVHFNPDDIQTILINEMNLFPDNTNTLSNQIGYSPGIRKLSFFAANRQSNYDFDSVFLFMRNCENLKTLDINMIGKILHFFTSISSNIKFNIALPVYVIGVLDFIQDLAVGKRYIWLAVNFNQPNEIETHANEVLIDNSENEVRIVFFDPHLTTESFQKVRRNSFGHISQSSMMDHVGIFIKMLTGKRVFVLRKHIEETCKIPTALQMKADIADGLCVLYSILMASTYLLNTKNNTIKNDYFKEEDVTCFFALMDVGAINLLAIVFYCIYRKYPKFSRFVQSEINSLLMQKADLSIVEVMKPLFDLNNRYIFRNNPVSHNNPPLSDGTSLLTDETLDDFF